MKKIIQIIRADKKAWFLTLYDICLNIQIGMACMEERDAFSSIILSPPQKS